MKDKEENLLAESAEGSIKSSYFNHSLQLVARLSAIIS
jgi:hypothetical protein